MTLHASAVASELGDLRGEPVGIGLLDALLGTMRLITSQGPHHLVFVGTAGALPGSGLNIGDVICAREVQLGDAALALGLGYSPRHPGALSGRAVPGVPGVVVITNLAITTDRELSARYAGSAQVEHMEAYGFALACERAGVAWSCLLGITNEVGPGAHAQWVANRARCEDAAREAARTLVTAC